MPSMIAVLPLLVGVLSSIQTAVQSIGVCYGTHGNNLPPPADVVRLYESNHIDAMRIYSPDAGILHALRGSNISVIVDAPDVLSLASSNSTSAYSAAQAWVRTNVQPYAQDVNIRYIAVGNEVEGVDTHKILPAMESLSDALSAAGLGGGRIKVSTSVKMSVIAGSPLPSGGAFADPSVMGPIVRFLARTNSSLLANIYPYYAYKNTDANIDLNFALFLPSSTTIDDDDNGHTYTNLFDAMVDSVYSAMEKEGGSGVDIVVSETGWPTAGGRGASKENARIYNQNLNNHVRKGTPKRPVGLESYLFAILDENQKSGDEIERHFGLFNPDKSPAYAIDFSGTAGSSAKPSVGCARRPVRYAMVIMGISLVLLF